MATADQESERSVNSMKTGRQRTMTEKGVEYTLTVKEHYITLLSKRLDKVERVTEDLLRRDDSKYEDVRKTYKDWLMLFEELLQYRDNYESLTTHSMSDHTDSAFIRSLELNAESRRLFKAKVDNWLQSKEDTRKQYSQLEDSTSYRSKSGRSCVSAQSLASARLKEEQRKVELEAKAAALKRKQELEIEKLKISMEEEKLELNTEMAISDAKRRVLDKFEQDGGSRYSDVSSRRNLRAGRISEIELDIDHDGLVNKHECNQDTRPRCAAYNPEEAILAVVRQLRTPVPEIKTFSGNPLDYHKFIRQFRSQILVNSVDDDERMNYLEQFTVGEANKIVSGYGYLDAEKGFQAAMKELEDRYGEEHVVVNAFVKRAIDWPSIKADNPKALDEFAIFLTECGNAVQTIPAVMQDLETEEQHEMKRSSLVHVRISTLKRTKRSLSEIHLTTRIMLQAEDSLVRYVQVQHFPSVLKSLTEVKQDVEVKARVPQCIQKLDPILVDGVVRVGGRLERADIPFAAKHPVLLPKDSPVSKLIIQDAHEQVGHMGKKCNADLCASTVLDSWSWNSI